MKTMRETAFPIPPKARRMLLSKRVSVLASREDYTRQEAIRVLGITEKQLKSAERDGLTEPSEQYGFRELHSLRQFLELRKVLKPKAVREAFAALRQRWGFAGNPLTDARPIRVGKKLAFQVGSERIEPITGQLLLDLHLPDARRVFEFPADRREAEQLKQKQRLQAEAQGLFEMAVHLEQQGAPLDQIIPVYEQALDIDPDCAAAAVNLGTIFFNERKLRDAERYYKRAISVNPLYALAHFNLANLYDERGDRKRAKQHYELAVGAQPGYADAHYNLALLLQSQGEFIKSVYHWQSFLKLDPTSSWAEIAKRELAKLRRAAVVQGFRGARLPAVENEK